MIVWPCQAQNETPTNQSQASLPLEEVLRLHKERDAALEEKQGEIAPPIDGLLDTLSFRGRILDQALAIEASIGLTIFEPDQWVLLPILKLGPNILIDSMSQGKDYSLATLDGQLMVLAKNPGRRTFKVSFLARADIKGDQRKVTIQPAPATAITLDLDVDASYFRLVDADGIGKQDSFRFFPNQGRFEVAWQLLETASPATVDVPRPALEPMIESAHLSTVSTLEGDIHHRLLYKLKFEGHRELEIEIPDGAELRKVFINRQASAFELDGRTLRLPVKAAQAGDRHATVELLLSPPKENYHLSGELTLTMPSTSWPINHFFARLSLPSVFTYRWSGGSLSPIEKVPDVQLTYNLPTPGAAMFFHQTLVQGSHPVLRVAYDIELEGQYFIGG